MKKIVKALSVLLVIVMTVAIIPLTPLKVETQAATFNDINASNVFIKVNYSTWPSGCVLGSITMMLRRAAICQGDSNWSGVTLSDVSNSSLFGGTNGTYCQVGAGGSKTYTHSGKSYQVGRSGSNALKSLSVSAKKEKIDYYLQWAEGIVVYNQNYPHAVLITDKTNGKYYCCDPDKGVRQEFPVSSKVNWDNITDYWYLKSPECHVTSNHTLYVNIYSNYATYTKIPSPKNSVSGDKNVLLKEWTFDTTEEWKDGLPDYSYSGASYYLERDYYTGTGYWNTKPDGTGYRVSQYDVVNSGLELSKKLGKDITNSDQTVNLYPEWVENTFTVNFYSNYADILGSSISSSYKNTNSKVNSQKTYRYTSTSISTAGLWNYTNPNGDIYYLGKTGYSSTGNWNTSPSGTGISVNENTTFANGEVLANKFGKSIKSKSDSINLYPEFTPNKYTVYFNANGGSCSTSSKTVTYDSTYGTLPTPTRTDYSFDGWYTSSSGGTRVNSYNDVKITSSQTLYAQWTPSHSHNYSYRKEVVAPTCKSTGYTNNYCSCGSYTTTDITPKASHTPKSGTAVSATCTKDGHTAGTTCSVCGTIITPQETIPATGHIPYVSKNATPACTGKGCTQETKCKICGVIITESKALPKEDHLYSNYVHNATLSTSTYDVYERACIYCGNKDTIKINNDEMKEEPSSPGKPEDNKAQLSIRNKEEKKDYEFIYKNTITFHADYKNINPDYIEWYVNDKYVGSGDSCTVKSATSSYKISCLIKNEEGKVIMSDEQQIKIDTSFLVRIIVFFLSLFGLMDPIDY